jgi:hypothetical protein
MAARTFTCVMQRRTTLDFPSVPQGIVPPALVRAAWLPSDEGMITSRSPRNASQCFFGPGRLTHHRQRLPRRRLRQIGYSAAADAGGATDLLRYSIRAGASWIVFAESMIVKKDCRTVGLARWRTRDRAPAIQAGHRLVHCPCACRSLFGHLLQ